MFKNRFKTVLLLAMLSGLLMLLGGMAGGTKGITFAFVLSLVINGIAYFYSDKMVLSLYKAKPLSESESPEIYRIVRELASRMDIPMPKIWVVDTEMANAFATGRNPSHASVAVTSGILDILSPSELRGVLAHELSHVKNRDILVSTVAATFATAIGYLANIVQWGAISGGRDDDKRRTNPLILLLIAFLMPVAASLIQLAVSRSREYMADEHGADVSEDPLALASALEKLEKNIPRAHLNQQNATYVSTAHMFIVHPFIPQGLMALFSTHPPTKDRVKRLRTMYEKMTER